MRFFFDTEFIEDGKTIDLLSIGIVAEDGSEYYAENCQAQLYRANDWVKANVLPKLIGTFEVRMTRAQIGDDIVAFVGENPEFWAYYADYDWVVLCQLYGTMMDLPPTWPMFCMDLKQLLVEAGDPRVPKEQDDAHNALADAAWVRSTFLWLTKGVS